MSSSDEVPTRPADAAEASGPAAPTERLPWDVEHAVAADLERRHGGADLACALDLMCVADLDDAALVEAVAAWERVSSWAAARQAEVVAEMTRRTRSTELEFLEDEVATRLAVSRRTGSALVARAQGLDAVPEVHDALASGAIDTRKADAMLRESQHLPLAAARPLLVEVLPAASTLTVPQLMKALRRAELQLDPSAAVERHRRATADRCVRLTPAPNSMAWITAFMPAPDAMAVMTTLDALAAASAPEDERPVDARRADALTDVMRGVLDRGLGPHGPVPTQQRRRPHLSLTVSSRSLAPTTPAPAVEGEPTPESGAQGLADLAGYGPIPFEVAAAVADEAEWRAIGVNPTTGEAAARSARTYRPSAELTDLVVDRDSTCTFPGCQVPARRCDIDHIEPFDGSLPAHTQTSEHNLTALCRHHHRLKTLGRWTPERDPSSGAVVWTSSTGHTYTRDPVPIDPEWDSPPQGWPRSTSPRDIDAANGAPPALSPSSGPLCHRASEHGSPDNPCHDGTPGDTSPDSTSVGSPDSTSVGAPPPF